MTGPARAVDIDRGGGPDAGWAMAIAAPHPALDGLVLDYCGYAQHSVLPARRRETASLGVHLIVSFGDPITVRMGGDGAKVHTSFLVGVSDTFGDTEFVRRQRGVQVNFTPLGAYRLLGLPMRELANEAVDLGCVPLLAPLADRLAAAPGWPARFDLLDDLLLRWAHDGRLPDPAVAWALSQLRRSNGRTAVADLAAEVGWSRRHFAARFAEQIGLPPKPTARVLRFQHARRLLTGCAGPAGSVGGARGAARSIADVAAECGFADHSHLVREFNRLGGIPPSQLVP